MFLAVTWKKRCLIYFNNLVMQSTPYRAKCQHNYCFRVFWYVCLYAWPKRFLGGRKVVLFFRLSGSWFCNIKVSGSFLDGTNLQIDRGVTRLDGARGKIQVWRPHFRTWGLPEANVLYWRMYVWHCWDFLAPPQYFSAPRVIRRPGNCALIAPSLRPCWLYHNAACKKLQTFTLTNNLPLCDKNVLNVLD